MPATVSEVDVDVFPGAGALPLAAESLLSETTVSVTVSAKPLEALCSSVVVRLDARSKPSLSAGASWVCSLFSCAGTACKREDARSLSSSLIVVKSACSGGSLSSRLAAETEFKRRGSLFFSENSSSASSESSEAATGSTDAWLEPIDSAPRVACAAAGRSLSSSPRSFGDMPSSGPAFPCTSN